MKLKNELKRIIEFGPSASCWRLFAHFNQNLYSKKHKSILKFLKKHFFDILQDGGKLNIEESKIDRASPIWIFLWQGIENAPVIVKKAVDSIINHRGSHVVRVLDKNNLFDYVQLPEFIYSKFEQGKISIVHLSDIIRVSLLQQYGGIWCDATLFFIDDIPDEIYGYSWYSVKFPNSGKQFVSEGKWSAYFMASCPNGLIVTLLKNLFYAYWQRYNSLIDYFLVDYALKFAYDHLDNVKRLIDDVPQNNDKIFWLMENLNEKFSECKIQEIKETTFMFKCNYRVEPETDSDSNFAHYFVERT